MPYIGTNTIGKLEIPLPPIEQQQKLSNTLKKIREKIILERLRVENSKDIKTGLMQDLLTGKVSVNTD